VISPEQFRQSVARLDAGLPLPIDIVQSVFSSGSVFANADLSLAHIEAYGFDYDFTIATYNRYYIPPNFFACGALNVLITA
jgi:hypothetical protein